MSGDSHDLVVIGGDPAGYMAAIRAAQLGLKLGRSGADLLKIRESV